MQRLADTLTFSPSDLNHFLECEHLITLESARVDDGRPRVRDPHAELLAQKGLEHERAWFERFRADGRAIVTVGYDDDEGDWQRRAARTLEHMRSGAEVIYQGVFNDGVWHGISDFLVRVDTPSHLGAWSYEAWDTKLARHSKPYFILQLCFYTEQLAILQGVDPRLMHVVLGTGQQESFAYREFSAYYRRVRQRFLEALREGRPTSPYPVTHCSLCDHERACAQQWEVEDHLSLVAGIRREQVQRLNDAGVRTVAELGVFDATSRVGIGSIALQRLVHQAALQTHHRRTGRHRYELLPIDEHTGFRLLPAPSEGDIFFDMEGYPFFEPAAGLEYLFGVVTYGGGPRTPAATRSGGAFLSAVASAKAEAPPIGAETPQTGEGALRFQAFQASNREEEKVAFERFVDFVQDRLRRWPDLHVYHYAAYEPSTLKRLMSEHATRENEIDDLLRREVFVDLYQVVRQSLRISHQNYSIKKVRTFFMSGAGQGAVTGGADSILEFERWLRTRDPAILDAIVRYNKEDCVSTVNLRDWLLERKREAEAAAGVEVPWKTIKPPTLTDERKQDDERILRQREQLLALGTSSSTVLAHLLEYHRREDKPAWWAYFDRQKKSLDDLLDDTEAIAYLKRVPGVAPETDKRSLVHTLRFPEQEYKLAPDQSVEDPFRKAGAGTIDWIDSANGQLGLKRGKDRDEPLPSAIVSGKPLDNEEQRLAIGRVAAAIIQDRPHYPAVQSLLARDLPRLRGQTAGASIQTLDLDQQKRIVDALDESYLFIQGPPGSGKTWTGARLIVTLIAAGKRVGVAANSHKAIHNLLKEVERVATTQGVTFRGLKKRSDRGESAFDGRFIENTDVNKECETSDAALIAGTSWLFARDGMERRLDYLFIDEAGQVSLADTVAMGTSARNLVLLGDPQQLPQVTQGIHPEGSGCSVLEHLLGSDSTVAENRGLFLARSWRMHPDVCAFISELSYDGRLASAAGCERQRIDSSGLSGTGLRYFAVDHEANAQQSPEEARVIAGQAGLLLKGGTFTDSNGRTRPFSAADILVVAPYNMQVRCLREALPPGVEVGTVDKFQGREAPIVFFSMASSSGEDVPRGLDFLFSRNRFNVAISRAKAMAVLVSSPRLLDTRCRTIEQMRLVNAVCQFVEFADSD